jgi:hypothetical protein
VDGPKVINALGISSMHDHGSAFRVRPNTESAIVASPPGMLGTKVPHLRHARERIPGSSGVIYRPWVQQTTGYCLAVVVRRTPRRSNGRFRNRLRTRESSTPQVGSEISTWRSVKGTARASPTPRQLEKPVNIVNLTFEVAVCVLHGHERLRGGRAYRREVRQRERKGTVA